jgi:hypothetical protein
MAQILDPKQKHMKVALCACGKDDTVVRVNLRKYMRAKLFLTLGSLILFASLVTFALTPKISPGVIILTPQEQTGVVMLVVLAVWMPWRFSMNLVDGHSIRCSARRTVVKLLIAVSRS